LRNLLWRFRFVFQIRNPKFEIQISPSAPPAKKLLHQLAAVFFQHSGSHGNPMI